MRRLLLIGVIAASLGPAVPASACAPGLPPGVCDVVAKVQEAHRNLPIPDGVNLEQVRATVCSHAGVPVVCE